MLGAVQDVAESKDASAAQVALAWLLEQPVVDAPIIGPRTDAHLEDSLGAVDVSLSDEAVERIAAPKTPRWPAPGKDT